MTGAWDASKECWWKPSTWHPAAQIWKGGGMGSNDVAALRWRPGCNGLVPFKYMLPYFAFGFGATYLFYDLVFIRNINGWERPETATPEAVAAQTAAGRNARFVSNPDVVVARNPIYTGVPPAEYKRKYEDVVAAGEPVAQFPGGEDE
ncbi:unnamed protein product [Pedinophyceae sp. YPF-701]|nr:unnamed protein product [Pedinophyceae sp. YPF-701]